MSDNKNLNDEYQYIEESDNSEEPVETSSEFEFKEPNPLLDKFQAFMTGSPLLRNSVIVVMAVIILGVIAKCSSSDLKKPKVQVENPKATPIVKAAPSDAETLKAQQQQANQLMQAQQDLQSSLRNLSQQVNQLNTSVAGISNAVQNYPQDMSGLQVKLNQVEQSLQELKTLVNTKKMVVTPVVKASRKISLSSFPIPTTTYYIQAIIPGRAWLISSNGETLTVSVGSRVPGYGVVEKIDAIQGLVEVSSNRILRFSQRF